MTRNNPSLLTVFSYLPWWVSLVAGTVVYVAIKFILPALLPENQIWLMMTLALQNHAWLFSGLFLIPAISSVFRRKKQNRLIERQRSIDTLRETTWSDFEQLVGEVFRRKGFVVQENMVGGADGGVDLTLSKDQKLHIVQCKQWRSSKVGVSVVREMYGVMKAMHAQSVFIVATGHFTKDATAFTRGLPIELIDGKQLIKFISEVQKSAPVENTAELVPSPRCPKCASPLVNRIAKQGVHKGSEFLGCSSFQRCKFIQ